MVVHCYGFGLETVKLAHATSKLKRDERGRKKGTPNKGLIKCRGDDTRCKACRNKMAPCHRRERPADCDCAYCASSPMLEAKEPNSSPPRTPTLLASTPSRSTVHAQKKHTYDEGHTNAEKQTTYRLNKNKKAKKQGELSLFQDMLLLD